MFSKRNYKVSEEYQACVNKAEEYKKQRCTLKFIVIVAAGASTKTITHTIEGAGNGYQDYRFEESFWVYQTAEENAGYIYTTLINDMKKTGFLKFGSFVIPVKSIVYIKRVE